MTTTGIVFIHGAGLGSWVWDEVKKHTNISCLAVDFPDRGEKKGVGPSTTLEDYSDHIISQVSAWGHSPFVIVAHSIGGVLALKVAAYFGNRVVGFVAISACIPPAKGSFIQALPLIQRVFLALMLRVAGTKPPDKAIRSSYCNDLDAEQAGKVLNRFVPESRRLYLDRCNARVPAVKSMFIRLSKDRSFPESLQNRMIANMKKAEVADLPSGHLPMLSMPAELAGVLQRFTEGCEHPEA
jgi:pimeloyl-ACP methyl ester carboxylesterase